MSLCFFVALFIICPPVHTHTGALLQSISPSLGMACAAVFSTVTNGFLYASGEHATCKLGILGPLTSTAFKDKAIKDHTTEGGSLAMDSTDTKFFVGYSQEHKVVAWTTQSFKSLWVRSFRSPDHTSIPLESRPSVQSLLFHDDLLFVGIFKGASRILDASNGTELKVLHPRPQAIYGMAVFTPMMLIAQTATTQGCSCCC